MKTALTHKLITCILPKGRAQSLMRVLIREHGLTAVDVHYARGHGRLTPQQYRGIEETAEKEVLTVAVPTEQAEAIFELIYDQAEINRPHGGLMYMHPLLATTLYTLPELPEEKN
ncbi:P-II family nitrogen regulator [Thiothrix nivea]|uniref:Nitrogen regulatory protein P-II n=1 Tax=Thiothrix nivea (strain ATCC 35100 / DSM 5205 / JP2) TaxID=870187 RepID=A0A656HFB6_THINJ|nr:P-II family nitrogen regulator [Thiothrix nivea]EIJ34176.1 hypothetical protein Thini_1579 [Thiothrix nivea DSM 5205]